MMDPKSSPKNQKIPYRKSDGSIGYFVAPKCARDVEQQQDIPAWALAVSALSPVVSGRHVWSRFTVETIRDLDRAFGDDVLRKQLLALMIDIDSGFEPHNPMGVYIHRVRSTPTCTTLT